jgi:lysophospholipase L1-like esterase
MVGDSVRSSYEPLLAALFDAEAKVSGPRDNSFDSRYTRLNLERWLGSQRPDIITWNNGLHDIRRDRSTGTHQVERAEYAENLEAIAGQLLALVPDRVVWLTITPVVESWHQQARDYDRINATIDDYNRIAKEIVTRRGIPVLDLHAVIAAGPVENLLVKDGVHLNDRGRLLAAAAIAEKIRPWLNVLLGRGVDGDVHAQVQASMKVRVE